MCENQVFMAKCEECEFESISKDHIHTMGNIKNIEAYAFCNGEKHMQEEGHTKMIFFTGVRV